MTSISQQQVQPPQAPSYASVSKKPFAPSPGIANPPGASGGIAAPAQDGKPETDSPVNGRNPIIPAVPTVESPAVNGTNVGMSSASRPGDHSRKSSVTISAAGASGHMPNGGPVTKTTGNNGIQFGTFNPDGSPAMANATPQMNQPANSLAVNAPNPRLTSPMSSPSPIPQPHASGGRPPSAFQGQGNGVNFGSMNGEDPNRQLRPGSMSQGVPPTGPQSSHLRRESSQSGHSDFGNQPMGSAQVRAGYPPQGSRGRGQYATPYPPQVPYSPGPNPNNFRPNPNTPRGAQNFNPGYQQQNRSLAPQFPPSPHQGNRSPALQTAHPAHHQQGQMPMGSPMYPQQYGGYPPNMGPYVNPHSSLPLRVNHLTPEPRKAQLSSYGGPRNLPTPDFSPASGNFEQFLTTQKQAQQGMPQGMQQGFVDPQYAAFYQQYYSQHGGFNPQGSPRPQQPQHMAQQSFFPGQYPNPQQSQSMSRTPSAISATDRPGSVPNRQQAPSTGPSSAGQAPAPRRAPSVAAPNTPSFQKPAKKIGLVIKDPVTGDVIDFSKQAQVSPGPKTSPANASAAPTPPLPRTASQPEVQHNRTESKSVRTDEEKRNDMRDAIAKKMEADKAEEKRKQEEEATKVAEEKKTSEAQALKEKEEADAKQQEVARAQLEAENAEKKAKSDAEEADKAAQQAKDEAEEKARKEEEEDEMYARIEAEEREAEERYQKKKQAEAEDKARKEAEKAKMADEDMKRAEREAEEVEEARIKKLETGEGDESQKERADLFAALKKEAPGTPNSEDTPAAEDSGPATPASEAPMQPPAKPLGAKPKPAALKLETTKQVESPQRSAQLTSLLSARRLLNINDVSYPSGFISPNPALNAKAPPGKFNYERNFLMQFRGVFVEKPSDDWEKEVKTIMGDTAEPSSARSASTRNVNPLIGGPSQRQASVNRQTMGVFTAPGGRTLPPGTTSQERFKQANSALQAPPGRGQMQNPFAQHIGNRQGGFPMVGTKSMERNPSQAGMGANNPHSPRGNASQRGGSTRGSKGPKPRESEKDAKNMPLTSGLALKPIEVSATGWKPRSVGQGATGMAGPAPGGDGHMAPDVVQRKVKSNLNKMTPNNFMKISDQVLIIAAQSKDETDGRTLRQVIQLTFEKATDEAHWAQMYAEFCKRMLESMSPEIKDEGILNKDGQVVVGGALFRKYLLNRCQTEFERGWKMNLPEKPEGESEEAAMLSDEYYVAAAAKRRGLGLVRFIGELFKLGMLTERIMHQCVHKLVDYEGMPDEAEVESLTSLLKTIGQNLDSNDRGSSLMDAYFQRIQGMMNTEGLPSRLRFMLMDIVDLRSKQWRSKDGTIKGPTTLEAVRAQAVAAEQAKEQERMRDAASRRGGGGGGRPPVGRGDARNFSGGSMGPPPGSQVGLDDIRRLQNRNVSRQANSQQAPTFGPSSMFASARGSNTRKPLFAKPGEDSGASSRTGTPPAQKEKKDKEDKETSKNAFSALASLDSGEPADSASPAASPPTTKLQPAEHQRSKSPLGKKDPGGEGSTL